VPSISQVIVWLIVGLIAGAISGLAVTGKTAGLGLWRNLLLGLAGAAVGGGLFWSTGLWPELDKIAVSLRDVVAAVCGSFIVLAGLWVWKQLPPRHSPPSQSVEAR
jgi:uncharacterized membrane protein YeaQ/YmgE (transglycosylase-associated protein family)